MYENVCKSARMQCANDPVKERARECPIRIANFKIRSNFTACCMTVCDFVARRRFYTLQ